ncbi:YopX family protein [Lactiplantibacillus plantarum]|uniref:YopX family protein n=1 Tax=Lactiplantibacillus plantarum TaxID=1590 RepID=UPI002DF4F1FD|nr:YopX family protein [Lactiplantibacillus plantarum]
MIKFRAWIKTGNETDDYVEPMTIQQMIHSKESTFSLEQLNDLVDFEQFTGLTDVNGKDIYIGDVVKAWSDMSELTMEPTVNEIVSEDLFGRPGVFLKPAGPHLIEPCLHDSWSNQFEVIGNVHTNPELLEVEK